MYKVVEFTRTNEVELVPALRIQDGQCYWPPLTGMELHQAIKDCSIAPDPSWTKWAVRIFYETNNYEEGRQKTREAEARSDLESDREVNGRPVRRKIKNVRLSPLDPVESENERPPPAKRLPPAPQIHVTLPLYSNPSPTPASKTFTPLTPSVTPTTFTTASFSSSGSQPILPMPAPSPNPSPSPSTLSHPFLPNPSSFSQQSFSDMLETWESGHEVPSLPGSQEFRRVQQRPESGIKDMLKEVLTKIEMVMDQQAAIMQLLQHHQRGPVMTSVEGLPLQNLDKLKEMELKLQSHEFKSNVVNYLGSIGGIDVRDTTWRVLRRTISNELARGLNWRGVNGKTSLASLRLRDVIVAAVRKNPLTATAGEADIEAVIKRWLLLSVDREGGRKRRLLAKENLS